MLGTSIAVTPSAGLPDHYDLTPGSEVGALELPGLSIRIHPKLPVDRVLFLASYSVDGLRLREGEVGLAGEPDLFEHIVAVFTAQVRRALRPGLLQGYRTVEEALPTIRGRILIEGQLKRLGLAPPIDVRYDEFTTDIEENRIVKAALLRLSKLRLRSERSRRELRGIAAALADVTAVEYGREPPPIHFTRLNNRYRPALTLARLILRSTAIELVAGRVPTPSFLIDMNRVFEDFVVHALRDEMRLSPTQLPQGMAGRRLRLDTAGRIALKPDISWWHGGHCVFVGDVKYKRSVHGDVPNADLYQLLAYTVATDLPAGLLIYGAGEREQGISTVRHLDKELGVVALDLAGSPETLLREISRIATLIRTQAQAAVEMPRIA